MTAVHTATAARLLREAAVVQRDTRQPSLVAGVLREGELVWSAVIAAVTGRTPVPARQGAGQDRQYRIGSITKTMTALAVLQCRDERLLDLEDRIGDHLGDVPFARASVRRLLSHSAGLPAEPLGDWWERHDGGDFADLTSRVATQGPASAAGLRHHYSNLGYGLLGELVGRLRGRPWIDAVTASVLEPLGMRRTTYTPVAPHAWGWSVHPYSGRLSAEPHTDTGAMAAAGQLWSTLADLARYAAFWLDPDPAVLAPATVVEMRTPQAGEPDDGLSGAYGLGLRLDGRGDRTLFGHSGSMPGFLAGFAVDPKERTAAITLSNGTTGGTGALAYTLLDRLAELEPAVPAEWVPEPLVEGADELLGEWYWGSAAFTAVVRDGVLRLEHANPGRSSRFVRVTVDHWRGLDSYFAGEPLLVQRDGVGAVTGLDLATYALTRTPQPADP
ncbi:MAG: serine hydrolase domain-containing protein [Nocardioidaceae bacterium]